MDKIEELIRKKEMILDIGYIDSIGKLNDYKRDIQGELILIEIILKNFKMPEKRIDEIKSQYLGDNIVNYF